MRILCILFATLALVGCGDPFEMEAAQFVGYNNTNEHVIVIVNGNDAFAIPARNSSTAIVDVPVPRNPVGTVSGPSTIDKWVDVTVAVRTQGTNKQTAPISCTAGAKVVTTVSYEVDSRGGTRLECDWSWGR